MKPLSQVLPELIDQTKANGQKPLLESQPQTSAMALTHDPKGRERLTAMLLVAYDGLRVYGKEPEQLDNANKLFQLVLADYTFKQIEKAFAFYLKTNNEMPAPADIANIIERGNRPAFDRTVYLRLVKRQESDPYFWNVLTAEEREYMKDYERFQVTGKY